MAKLMYKPSGSSKHLTAKELIDYYENECTWDEEAVGIYQGNSLTDVRRISRLVSLVKQLPEGKDRKSCFGLGEENDPG